MAMEKVKKDIVRKLLKQNFEEKDETELLELLVDSPLSIDVDKKEDEDLTFGERAADKISAVAGSWSFIIVFILFLLFWIGLNTIILLKAVDPFPFILLNLLLSCIAALQAPVIMMSQNRQAVKDRLRSQNDYRINLKNELISEMLHHQLETVIKNQSKILSLLESNKDSVDKQVDEEIPN